MKENRECAVCPTTTALKACSKCKKAFYCSTEHAKLLWPIHKRFCGTGVEPWFEDDLTEAELEDLERESWQGILFNITHDRRKRPLKTIALDFLPPGTPRKASPSFRGRIARSHSNQQGFWKSTGSESWTQDPLLRSWLISLARDFRYLVLNTEGAELRPLGKMTSPLEGAWNMISSTRLATSHPSWNLSAEAFELRNKFLLQAVIARYLELRIALDTRKAEEEYFNALLAAERLRIIASSETSEEPLTAAIASFASRQIASLQRNWKDYQSRKASRRSGDGGT
ncbi:hypothetical protein BCR35DRAFT_349536 [Leucosporidium creatinivorum]|uniref:MYND-type domain-containing protein n=1 Tax=Leucosporidium creatinivorum TaxID=106004 RepID=A0A1Y2G5I0_9BASI|nr:hypothetical protein BCR35DRAFT_349536 [Leucosporidium creatinivorum]